MTPYEQLLLERRPDLLLEALPTGTFGGPRRVPPPPVSREDAARHYAELAAAIGERHLRPVHAATETETESEAA